MDAEEGMCYGAHCELCKTEDSQTYTPETNHTVYVNFFLKKKVNGKYNWMQDFR